MWRTFKLLGAYLIFILASCLEIASADNRETAENLFHLFQGSPTKSLNINVKSFSSKALDDAFIKIYKLRNFEPLWVSENPTYGINQAIKLIEDSYLEGLEPYDYFLPLINSRVGSRDSRLKAELDLLLTAAVISLASDAEYGRTYLRRADSAPFEGIKIEAPDPVKIAGELFAGVNLEEFIRAKFPVHKQYYRMKKALATYREIQHRGGWEILPKNISPLRRESTGEGVKLLVDRLKISSDLAITYYTNIYDTEVGTAVKKFQNRHGILATGEVHEKTLSALNITVSERIKTILINLERWRWLSRDFSEGKEVYVNLAGYELFGVENSIIKLRLPVIVGKAYHASPVFSATFAHIEVNPVWNVPNSIAANEILPALKQDSNYFQKHHMLVLNKKGEEVSHEINWKTLSPREMHNYHIKQTPGSWNVLGSLKFVFPNKYSVYLHDTGSPSLFKMNERALSHGCIRVSNPVELAVFLLNNPGDFWDSARVRELISKGKNMNVKLSETIKLYLTYRTGWVELDGTVNFRPDIYNRDKRMLASLE